MNKYQRLLLWSLVVAGVVVLTASASSSAYADYPLQEVTSTPTVYYCPATSTPTSLFGTPQSFAATGFPTLLIGTPLPPICVTVPSGGEVCYTPTAGSTPSVTPSITPTLTATIVPSVTSTPNTQYFMNCLSTPSTHYTTCTSLEGGQHLHYVISKPYSITGWQAPFSFDWLISSGSWYAANVYVVSDFSWNYTGTNINFDVDYTYYSQNATANFTHPFNNTPVGSYANTDLITVSNEATIRIYGSRSAAWLTGGSGDVGIVDIYTYPPYVSTATPAPSITPTPTGCVVDDSQIMNITSDWLVVRPPSIVHGGCYTILPEMTLEIPDIVLETWAGLPETLGIPGIQICLDYWTMTMQIFGFDVIAALGLFVSFVSIVGIVREFRS